MTGEIVKFYNRVTGNSLLFHADKGNIPYLHEVLARPNNGLSPHQKARISEILNAVARDALLPSGQRTGLKSKIAALLNSEGDIIPVQRKSFFQRLPLAVLGKSLSYLDRRDITALSSLCNDFQAQHQHAIYLQFAEKKHFTYEELEDFRLRLHLQKIADLFAINPALSETREVSLTFQDIPISDRECIALISHCPRLSGIEFINCPHIKDESILRLAEKCPELSSIWIENCERLRDASLYFSHFPHLVKIGFKGNSSFDPASYVNIPRACPHLRVLELIGTRFIEFPTISALFSLCPSLEELHMDRYQIQPELMSKLVPNLKKTTFMDIGIEVFQRVIELFPDIAIHNETIHVPGQPTQEAFIQVIKHCPKLKNLHTFDFEATMSTCIMLAKYTLCRDVSVNKFRSELQQKPTSKLAGQYQNLLKCILDNGNSEITKHLEKHLKEFSIFLKTQYLELSIYHAQKINYQIAKQQGEGYVSNLHMHPSLLKINNHVLLSNFLESMLSQQSKAYIFGRGIKTVNNQNLSHVDAPKRLNAPANRSSETLMTLNFSKRDGLQDGDFKLIEGRSGLNFSEYTNITDRRLIAYLTLYKSLDLINLSDCSNLTDASIIELAKAHPHLTEFNASGVVQLTSNAIKMLAASCPKLKVVKLLGCDNLEADSVNALISNCKNLSHLETSIWKKCGPDTALALAKSQCREFGTSEKHSEFFTAVKRFRAEYTTSPKTDLGRYYHSLVDKADEKSILNLTMYFFTLPPLSPKLQNLFSENWVQFCDTITPEIISGEFPPLPNDMSIDTTYGPSQILEFSSDISEEQIINKLKEEHNKIKTLILDGYQDFTQHLINAICKNMVNLTHISLEDCTISDNYVFKLIKSIPKLRHINIRCDSVSENTVKILKAQFPSVHIEANEASENKGDD